MKRHQPDINDLCKFTNRELCKVISSSSGLSLVRDIGNESGITNTKLISEFRRRLTSFTKKDLFIILKGTDPDRSIVECALTEYVRREIQGQRDISSCIHKLVVLVNIIPSCLYRRMPQVIEELLSTSLEASVTGACVIQLLYVMNKVSASTESVIPYLHVLVDPSRMSLPPDQTAALLLAIFRLELHDEVPCQFLLQCVNLIINSIDTTCSDVTVALLGVSAIQSRNPLIQFPVQALTSTFARLCDSMREIDRYQLLKALSVIVLSCEDHTTMHHAMNGLGDRINLLRPANDLPPRQPPTNTSRVHEEVQKTVKRMLLGYKSEVFVPSISSYIDIVIGTNS